MMYKVIAYFTDMQDGGYPYNAGDTYPHTGITVSAERIKELSTSANLRGIPLIEEVRGAEKTVATTEEDSDVDADNADPVEEEPKKRGRKRRETENE